MQKFTTLTGVAAPLPMINVDTDKIIPKQYLKTIERTGLGKALFDELRYNADGSEKSDFVLNQPAYRKAEILVAGENFGCGSSREHAPWALLDYGFRAVISTEIADIFRNNSLKNGLLPIVVDATTSDWLMGNPGSEVTIDLVQAILQLASGVSVRFPIDPFARYCLLNGVDELGFLLQQQDRIAAYEQRHKDN